MPVQRPQVRPLEPMPVESPEGQLVVLRDPWRYVSQTLSVAVPVYVLMTLMDGTRDLAAIRRDFAAGFKGEVSEDDLTKLVGELDAIGLLEGESFERIRREALETFHAETVRPAAFAGTAYEGDADALRAQIDGFGEEALARAGDAIRAGGGPVVGLVAPHIDPRVGGACAAAPYLALTGDGAEFPELFVVFGTAHQPSDSPFILTEKAYETPLGRAETDAETAAALRAACPADLLRDEYAHKHEHSIEFQIPFLQRARERAAESRGDAETPPLRILPVLVGSFHQYVAENEIPSAAEPVACFVDALRQALAATGRRVCFVAGADLSHMGRKFGDDRGLDDGMIEETRTADRLLLDRFESVDFEGFFRQVQIDGDSWKVCGLPPIYAMMCALGEEGLRGTVLDYDLSVEEATQSLVSYASGVLRRSA